MAERVGMRPKTFTLHVPDAAIADLRERLARTRLPDEPPLRAVVHRHEPSLSEIAADYWQNGFDWRAWEGKLNGFRQFTVPIARHRPAFHPRAGRAGRPDAAAALARLARLGVRVPQAIPLLTEHFTVVAPSLPGYTLSFKPGQQRFGVERDRRPVRRADDRRARLRALRRAGRRLGRRSSLRCSAIVTPSASSASTSICWPCGAIPR